MKQADPRAEHELMLLKGGTELFPAMVKAIDAARFEVMLETYIFDFSRSALGIAQALEAAAKRGVTVRVVVDGLGTGDVPEEWRARWAAAGVRWRIFNPAQGWRLLVPRRWRRLHASCAWSTATWPSAAASTCSTTTTTPTTANSSSHGWTSRCVCAGRWSATCTTR